MCAVINDVKCAVLSGHERRLVGPHAQVISQAFNS